MLTRRFFLFCHSLAGVAMTPFHVAAGRLPLSGLQAEYFTAEGEEDLCERPGADWSLTRRAMCVEKAIARPQQAPGTVWPLLPAELFPRLVVRWRGYLVLAEGSYVLQMIYRDGLRVKVNGTTLVDDWKCQQMLQQRSVAVESLGSPLSLVVEYFSGGGVFGVEISVTEASGRTVNAPFGYVPQTLLSYRVTQGRLYRGLTLASMMPIVFNNFQPQSFAVAPLLPAGVEIANGIVFGTPRSDAPEGFFTVTAVGAQGSAETTLRLDVQTMLPPTQLRLEDTAGNNVTRVSVPQFQRLVPLTLRWSGRVSDYSVYPSLPRGLAFDRETATLQGVPTSALRPTHFEFSVSNDVKIERVSLELEVTGCAEGPFVYSWLEGGDAHVIVRRGETVVFDGPVKQGLYGLVLCVPPQRYVFSFNCSQHSECFYALMREDDLTYRMGSFQGLYETQVDLNVTAPPLVTLNRTVFYTSPGYPFLLSLDVQGAFLPLVFSPPLPSSLRFDKEHLIISGNFTAAGRYSFRVIASNACGSSSVVFSVYVDACPSSTVLLHFRRKNSLAGDYARVVYKGEEVTRLLFSGGAYFDMFCVQRHAYTLFLHASSPLGWTPNSELVITDTQQRLVGSFSVVGQQQTSFPFALVSALAEASFFRLYAISLPPSSRWNLPSFDASAWEMRSASQGWGKVASGLATVYFRRNLETACADSSFLRVSIKVQDGGIVYVNGREILRVNLPPEGVDHSTPARSRFPTLRWVDGFIAASQLESPALLAVEIHRFRLVEPEPIVFDAEARCLSGNALTFTENTLVSSNHTIVAGHEVAAAQDGNHVSAWEDGLLPVWVESQFLAPRVINRVDMQAGRFWWWEVPHCVRVVGLDEEGSEQVLKQVSSALLFPSPYAVASLSFANDRAFARYRVDVLDVLCGSAAQFAEIAFLYEKPVFCEGDGEWPTTALHHTATAECGKRRVGGLRRTCEEANGEGTWSSVDESGCVATTPTYGVAFVDWRLSVSNCSLPIWERQVRESVSRAIASVCVVDELSFFFVTEFNGDTFGVLAEVRAQVARKRGNEALECLQRASAQLPYLVYKYGVSLPERMQFNIEGEFVLRKLASWIFFLVVVLVLVLVATWKGYGVWWRRSRSFTSRRFQMK